MTAREKVIDVDRQIHAMLAGEQTDFQCPFCNLTTSEGEGILCCDEAAEVINAILDHLEHMERCEIVERAMDRLHSMPSRVILN
jgi:hypothetical protein